MAKKRLSLSVLKHLGEQSSDGYVVYDFREHEVLYANPSTPVILQVPEPRPMTANFLRSCIKEDEALIDAFVARLLSDGRIENVELRLLTSDHFIELNAYLLRGDELVICVFKDVSKPKQFLKYIAEFGAIKDATLDMIAHNLSGPLNLTDNLLSAIDRLPDAQNAKMIGSYTRLIRENTHRCVETINSLLENEHYASENVFVKPSRFDILTHIRLVIDCIKPFHQDKSIVLNSAASDIFVSFDDVKFFQIIHNLLSNAVKFTPLNGTVTVEVGEDEIDVWISVTDNGIGIPVYLRSHVFEKNTPAARPGLKGEKSIGMGLYIVRKLVHLLRGRIDFSSEEEKGTTFVVRLPKVYLRQTDVEPARLSRYENQ
jgi:two-component system sensor histidine kinase VicK